MCARQGASEPLARSSGSGNHFDAAGRTAVAAVADIYVYNLRPRKVSAVRAVSAVATAVPPAASKWFPLPEVRARGSDAR